MSLPNNLGRLSAGLTADASLNIGVGVTPSGTYKFEVGTTSKFTGVATFGSTISNGTYTYTLPSATGTLALTSAIPTNAVGASGFWTSGFLAKINGTYTVTSSIIQDDGGSHVAIGYLTNPSLYMLDVNGTGRFTSNIKVGGGTLSSWATVAASEVLNSGFYGYSNNVGGIAVNIYYNSGWKYMASSVASARYELSNGSHIFYSATGGTAGTAATESTLLTIASTGAATFSGDITMAKNSPTIFMNNATSFTSGQRGAWYTQNSAGSATSLIQASAITDNVGTSLDFYTRPAGGSLAQVFTLASTGAATFTGNNATNTTENSSVSWNDLNGNLMGKIVGYRGVNGNDGNLRFYTSNTPTLALTLASTGAATFSSSVTATSLIFKDAINSNSYGFRGLSGIVTLDAGSAYPTGWNFQYGGGASSALYINGSGNVGIGVTPSAWATSNDVRAIQLKAGAFWNYSNFSTYFGNNYYWDGSARRYIISDFASEYQQVYGEHVWFTAPTGTAGNSATFTERMRITSSGNVLIGTTTDNGYKVRIDGGASNSGNSFFANGMVIGAQSNGSDYPSIGYNVKFTSSSTYNYYAADYASFIKFNVGKIETYTAPASSGVMSPTAGPYVALGGTSWTSSSDERLKNINSNIDNAINKLMTLRAVNFSWKYDNENKEYLGLIAQDLQKVYPQVVVENDDDVKTLGVNYTELIPVLVKAIQEQQEQIKELQSQINK